MCNSFLVAVVPPFILGVVYQALPPSSDQGIPHQDVHWQKARRALTLAEVLRITDNIRNGVKVVDGKVEDIGDKVEDVGDQVADVSDKVEDVGDKVEDVGDKVEDVGDKVKDVRDKVEDMGDKVEDVGVKVKD